jgi:hypothetical protein
MVILRACIAIKLGVQREDLDGEMKGSGQKKKIEIRMKKND